MSKCGVVGGRGLRESSGQMHQCFVESTSLIAMGLSCKSPGISISNKKDAKRYGWRLFDS
jgi:hypothetical protein